MIPTIKPITHSYTARVAEGGGGWRTFPEGVPVGARSRARGALYKGLPPSATRRISCNTSKAKLAEL
jgi:hypothetical protein